MSHVWKNIVVFFDHSAEGQNILNYAGQLAHQFDAHLVGIFAHTPTNERYYNSYARGSEATQEVVKRYYSTHQELIDSIEKIFNEVVKKYSINAEFRTFHGFLAADDVALHSFYCDLVLVGSVTANNLPSGWSPERILLKTGVPVIIIPPAWHTAAPNKKILIAWNASPAARRAVVDALPLLVQATSVRLLIIDSQSQNMLHGEKPGKGIALYLTRHGVNSDVLSVESNNQSVTQVIIDNATSYEADLIVIGAYSRSRLSEMILGGVTKNLLSTHISRPVFVSH